MFPTSGLFGHCPIYSTCSNKSFPPCLFSHSQPPPLSQTQSTSTSLPTSIPQKRAASTEQEQEKQKKSTILVRKRIEDGSNPVASTSKLASSSTSTAPSSSSKLIANTSKSASREIVDPNVNTGPPRLKLQKGAAHTPLVTRQKMLSTFHTAFVELYTPGILPTSKRYMLASKHALEQENSIYSKSTKMTYRNSCISSLARLKKRPSASKDYETGTNEEFERKSKEREEREKGKLTKEKVESFVAKEEELKRFGYLLEVPEGEGGAIPNEVGQKRMCDRCKREFMVKNPDEFNQEDRRACSYHSGKLTSQKIGGTKQRVYSCCPTAQATPCQLGPHVFKDEDPIDLHSRCGFIDTSSLPSPSNPLDLIALDCELFYTTSGMSLARLTVLNEAGQVLYDVHVKPSKGVQVIDLNTRFSGITFGDLDKAEKDLEEVRSELVGRWMGKDTVVVGHGVENDLRALRVVHRKVIDTAILFPHPNGGTWRYALRTLTKDILKKFIQDSDPSIGHSAKDDAEAALELVRWKVLQKGRGKES